jgi:rhodanese-related sulfurtransferase
MRKVKFWMVIVGVLSLVLWGCFQNLALDSKTPRKTKEELKSMLNHPDLIIIDVRLEDEWEKTQWKIAGAVRNDPEKVNSWVDKYPTDKTLVFYCS